MTEQTTGSFLDKFKSQDEEFSRQTEEMTFEEYLDEVRAHPEIARNATQRIHDMILKEGSSPSEKVGAEKVPHYHFFDDGYNNGEDAIFGIEDSLDRLVTFLKSSAKAQDANKRFLLLHGPVATAKSTLARLLKRGLERYSRTDEGRLYTFEWIRIERDDREKAKGITSDKVPCPMHEDPLKLLPTSLGMEEDVRLSFLDKVNEGRKPLEKIRIFGDLDPLCQFYYDQLLKENHGNWQEVLRNHIKVKRFLFRESTKKGIGTFQPKDEKNQDSTELTGDVDFTKIPVYGSETDPRVFAFNGEFMIANRGLLEFVEVLKLQVEFLYDLLGATAEKQIKGKGMSFIDIDTFLLGHTNGPEFSKFIENVHMEALENRMIRVDVPYNLELSEEAKIYSKMKNSDKFEKHWAPHLEEVAATFALLTRVEEPLEAQLSLLQKIKLYDGREGVGEYSRKDIPKLRAEVEGEGMKGVSPRIIQDLCDVMDNDSRFEKSCISPYLFFEVAEAWIDDSKKLSSDDKKAYKQFLSDAKKEYHELAKDDIRKALCSDEEDLQALCDKYIDHATAYMQKNGKVKDEMGHFVEPDEKFLARVEGRAEITQDIAKDFRAEIVSYANQRAREGKDFKYDSNELLYEAFRKDLFQSVKGELNLVAMNEGRHKTERGTQLYNLLLGKLKEFGYCELCAKNLIQHTSSLFHESE